MTVVRRLDRALTALVTGMLVLLFTVMLGLAAAQVVLRILFNAGTIWGDVAARHLVIWVGFLGAYMATKEDKHFHVDILTRFLSPRWRAWLAAFSDLFAVAVCYFLLQASVTFIEIGMDAEAMAFLQVPQQVVATIVPIGFALMMVQFLIRSVENIVGATARPAPEGPPA